MTRFGYVGSTLPPHATPADQADAYAALLDQLGFDKLDVVGISAGATSVLQFALRHPQRVERVVVMSGNLPGATTAVVQPAWARMVSRQLPIRAREQERHPGGHWPLPRPAPSHLSARK